MGAIVCESRANRNANFFWKIHSIPNQVNYL